MTVAIKARASVQGLKDIYHPDYPGFGAVVPDQYRADIFLKEFHVWERTAAARLTIFAATGKPHQRHLTRSADTAPAGRGQRSCIGTHRGGAVEQPVLESMAIFVVEDDAQNGVDHVDGHRTVALMISPWIRRKAVDSHFYTTINLFRTMEQITRIAAAKSIRPGRGADVSCVRR